VTPQARLAIVLAWILAGSPAAGSETGEPASTRPRSARATLEWGRERRSVCGIHAAYLMLQLCRAPVSFAEVEESVGRNDVGNSMLALRDAIARHGVECRVRRVDVRRFDEVELPFIGHCRMTLDRDGIAVGHFVVVTELDDDSVTYFDATSGRRYTAARRVLEDKLTGFVLARSSGPTAGAWIAAVAGGVFGACVVGLLRRRRAAAMALGALVAVGALGPGAEGATGGESAASAASQWRNPGRDGLNSVAFFLAARGRPVALAELARESPALMRSASLADLHAAAESRGARARIVRSGPEELRGAQLPAIAYVDGGRNGGGAFVVLIQAGATKVTWLDAGLFRLVESSWDDFVSRWSGHLLVADGEAGGATSRFVGIALAAGLATAAGVLGVGRWRSSRTR